MASPKSKVIGPEEKKGLTFKEIELAESTLITKGPGYALSKDEAFRLYELYLLGWSFSQIIMKFPEYPMDKIVLTAALHLWGSDRARIAGTLKNRIQAKVVKAVVEQVDFLTEMLSDAASEAQKEAADYKADPINNPKPKLTIRTLNDYKLVMDMLHKLTTNPGRALDSQSNSIMMSGLKNMDALSGGLATQENTYIDSEDTIERAEIALANLAYGEIKEQRTKTKSGVPEVKAKLNDEDAFMKEFMGEEDE